MKQKQSYGILSKATIVGRNKISVHTKAAVLSLYENGEFTYLMPGIKDFSGVSRNVCQQKWLILCILKKLYAVSRILFIMSKMVCPSIFKRIHSYHSSKMCVFNAKMQSF